jgi:hypothetical protein
VLEGWEFAGLPGQQVALVAGVGAAIAILLFLLRPRPPVVEVSSHVLWEQVLGKRRNPLLKELLMLLLQIVAIGAVALALGEPRRTDDGAADAELEGAILDRVWVIDRSLSMGAADEAGVARIDRVSERLRSELIDLDDRVRVGVVGAAAGPELLAPVGTDRQRVGLSLRMLDVASVEADLSAALELAIAQPGLRRERGLIEVFTDDPAAEPVVRAFGEERGWPVVVRSPFEPRPNVAIVAFDLRASEGIPAEEEAVVRLRNHAPWHADVLLRLETHAAVLGEASVRLPPGGEVTRRYRFQPLEPGGVQAVLRQVSFDGPDGPVGDALAADDRAFAWIQPVRPVRVMLVSDGNRFLERVLVLLPGADLETLSPSKWGPSAARRAADVDVVFLDGFVPEGAQPPRAFYVNPPEGGPFEIVGRYPEPAVTDWNQDHPLFEGLVLRDLNVLEAAVLAEEPGDARLVGSPSGALVLARESATERHVGWGFDFGQSDLPLRLAFPQTMVNTLLWMRRGRAVGEPPGGRHRMEEALWIGALPPAGTTPTDEATAPDDAVEVAPEDAPAEVAIAPEQPGGLVAITDLEQEAVARDRGDDVAAGRATRLVAVGDGLRPFRFPRPGLWRVAGEDWERLLAVNLFESVESRLFELPPDADDEVPPPPPAAEPEPDRGPAWMWLGALVGVLLLGEFGIYTR